MRTAKTKVEKYKAGKSETGGKPAKHKAKKPSVKTPAPGVSELAYQAHSHRAE